jgi:hypothetical protein
MPGCENSEPVTIDLIALIKESPYLVSLLEGFDALVRAWKAVI